MGKILAALRKAYKAVILWPFRTDSAMTAGLKLVVWRYGRGRLACAVSRPLTWLIQPLAGQEALDALAWIDAQPWAQNAARNMARLDWGRPSDQ